MTILGLSFSNYVMSTLISTSNLRLAHFRERFNDKNGVAIHHSSVKINARYLGTLWTKVTCVFFSFIHSFTWLCSQVHTGLVTHFRGQIVAEFEKEFRYLYAESRAVTSFCVPDPETCPSSQNTSKVVSALLKPPQVNDVETTSPSSSLSNVSIRSIKVSPFLKNSNCNVQLEKQDSSSDSGNNKGKEDASLKPTCPKQQGEPPDSPNCPPNKSTPALYHKSNLMTARTFLPPELSPALSSNKPCYQGDNTANSSHCSPPTQEQSLQSLSEGASSNGTSTKQKGPAAAPEEPTAENNTTFYGLEKRQSPGQGNLDLLSPYNQPKRDKKPGVPCYDKLTEDMLMEKNSAYGAEKRMTLGHSKLDLITKYNKLKSKHIHSRFELWPGSGDVLRSYFQVVAFPHQSSLSGAWNQNMGDKLVLFVFKGVCGGFDYMQMSDLGDISKYSSNFQLQYHGRREKMAQT